MHNLICSFSAALNVALNDEVERLKCASREAVNPADTYNTGLQQFPLNESLLPQYQEQQHFNFHMGIQSPVPAPSATTASVPSPQPQPTFSNHQIFVGQQHDHDQIFVDQNHDHNKILADQHHDLNLSDTLMPQKEFMEMQELGIYQ